MHRYVPMDRLQGILSNNQGLSKAEAALRIKKYGPNDIIDTSASPLLIALQDTLRDPMLWFLVATSILFLSLGEFVESFVLFAAIIPLIGMDFYLHRRTQTSTQGLKNRLAATAHVIRDGSSMQITTAEIVPGDLVLLTAGDYIPADGVLLSAEVSQFDESVITGESFPLRKQSIPRLDPETTQNSVDSVHWVYAGTRLLTGSAKVRVIFTGCETLYGEIVRSVVQSRNERTQLQKAIAHLVGILIIAATLLCLLLALVRLYQGFGYLDALMSALVLAVAALPEEFPVVFTFYLGVGIYRLAQRGALVRRAVAVENIGRITYICSDKTGTLTEGKLKLVHCFPAKEASETDLLKTAAGASRSETHDPLDFEILQRSPSEQDYGSAMATFPFTEDRKRETAIYKWDSETLKVCVKGAPETILKMCTLSEQELADWNNQVSELAMTGHKVIGCASLIMSLSSWHDAEPEINYEFAGLLAFEDPVRKGVSDAIQECLHSHIHVLMITGDHQLTARAVANEIGLGGGKPLTIINADELKNILKSHPEQLKDIDVVARAVPSEKLEIVTMLKSMGETVAVTGDGVNDVPALQAADIGIAMGERGTRSARESASVVLLDDNFRTIIHAILAGRQLFKNLQLSFAYLLIIHIPLVITAAIIPLFGFPLLYLPLHIVWLELIIHPTALLVFQEMPLGKKLSETHRVENETFFAKRHWVTIFSAGLVTTLMLFVAYLFSLGSNNDVNHARAMAMVMLIATSVAVTITLSELSSMASKIIVATTIFVSIVIVQIPSVSAVFHMSPLHITDLLICISAAVFISLIVWRGKFNRG
ncbi:MAG: haloacid dehalogenase [Methylophaga sp.]|jgi:Ca2+-transporting ATPase|nr:haloacid dehalogenase [Methylophaga sp.]MBP24195.1 haloacid dehalogenase [Methylophaga sp.]